MKKLFRIPKRYHRQLGICKVHNPNNSSRYAFSPSEGVVAKIWKGAENDHAGETILLKKRLAGRCAEDDYICETASGHVFVISEFALVQTTYLEFLTWQARRRYYQIFPVVTSKDTPINK